MKYPRGDARNLFVLLAAVDKVQPSSLYHLPALTGHNRGSIRHDVERLEEQYGATVGVVDGAYRVTSWGVLKEDDIKEFWCRGREVVTCS